MLRIDRNPSPAQLRLFGTVLFPLFALIAGWLLRARGGLDLAAWIVWGLGALALALAAVRPGLVRGLYLTLIYATYPIGFLLSHMILIVVYYAVLTPVGVALRLVGRDPLRKTGDRRATTYWREREPAADLERYFRQY